MSVVSRKHDIRKDLIPSWGEARVKPSDEGSGADVVLRRPCVQAPAIPPAGSGAPTIGWKTKWAVLARALTES
jgi:hypothetical protein